MTEHKQFLIQEVSNWLLPESEVQLPVVQRGFVWKASQIECLWDSIFRGYPIGSMMLSRTGNKLLLLDGQQRSTAISLGFYNPWENTNNSIGNAKNLPVVWIDVKPKEKTDTYEFAFRVVTRSHPWGYQMRNNALRLPVGQRSKASEMYKNLFEQSIYTQLLPKQRLPYDATCPIPLCFLLDAVHNKQDINWLIDKCKEYIPAEYKTAKMNEDDDYYSLLESVDLSPLFNIVNDVVLPTKLPAIVLSNELLIDKNDTSSNDSTLFVRLNSQGTKIEGEELMFSMYKAVCPETKELVEFLGMNFIPPSRVITLTSRLILSTKGFTSSLSLSRFRDYVQDETFINKLKEFIGTNEYSPIKEKIECAIGILRYGNVPDVIIKKYIQDSPNGFLLLLHWLFENDKTQIDDTIRKKIASRLYRNHWFGKDFDYYVKKNWNSVSQSNFWDDEFYANEGWIRQFPLISPELLLSFLESRLDSPLENHDITPNASDCNSIWQFWTDSFPRPENISDEDFYNRTLMAWKHFLWKLLNARDKSLILLAQRDYINQTFSEYNQIENLEDTNTPWDWDHIYPQSWVYRQQRIDPRTKLWEWRIGNFRAMSLTDNRSENNNLSPAERFQSPNAYYFIKENDLKYWKLLNATNKYVKEGSEKVLIHAKAIITRTVNIYENFLNMFIYS